MRNWPVPSVTAVRTRSSSAGLSASTETPGSTAPDSSLTTPVIDACACCKGRQAQEQDQDHDARCHASHIDLVVTCALCLDTDCGETLARGRRPVKTGNARLICRQPRRRMSPTERTLPMSTHTGRFALVAIVATSIFVSGMLVQGQEGRGATRPAGGQAPRTSRRRLRSGSSAATASPPTRRIPPSCRSSAPGGSTSTSRIRACARRSASRTPA